MPKRTRKQTEPDENQLAHYLIQKMTEEKGPVEVKSPVPSDVSRIMAEMGRKGGKIGGARRAARMTGGQRSEAASKAARARWGKRISAADNIEQAAGKLAKIAEQQLSSLPPLEQAKRVQAFKKIASKTSGTRAKSVSRRGIVGNQQKRPKHA